MTPIDAVKYLRKAMRTTAQRREDERRAAFVEACQASADTSYRPPILVPGRGLTAFLVSDLCKAHDFPQRYGDVLLANGTWWVWGANEENGGRYEATAVSR